MPVRHKKLSPGLDCAHFGKLSASGIDPEEVFRRDKLEGLIERHDKGAEVTRSAPSLSSPPQHLNLVALAGWPQARNGAVRAPAVGFCQILGQLAESAISG